MQPDAHTLLHLTGINTPPIGFYDVIDPQPFKPFAEQKLCYFSSYDNWKKGESLCISTSRYYCLGGRYWIGGIEFTTKNKFARFLNQMEGFKSSDELMCQYLDSQKPYIIKNKYVVLGPLKADQYEHLKTVTFFVNPDQLSLLLLGAEYTNGSITHQPVRTTFGSGCGQLAAVFGDLDTDIPQAVLGATDIAMRKHLPPDILAFTVNKPMYKQLCELNENSFLYKDFRKELLKARGKLN
ncbi:MAG: DUF169 domain-containing protein [Spirochaetales bacterium]|nr:DUF169 domain-containing protein [Spirochaetales bacterium]